MAGKPVTIDAVEDESDDFVDVKAVRNEFRIIEDAALAQKLQDEEFQNHYIRNRKDRGTARIDVKTAKNAYLEEIKDAGILTRAELQALSEDNVWLASELNKRVKEEGELEKQQKQAFELQDEEYARYLQEKERERIQRERRRRLEMRVRGNQDQGPAPSHEGHQHQQQDVREDRARSLVKERSDSRGRVDQERYVARAPTDDSDERGSQELGRGTRNNTEASIDSSLNNDYNETAQNVDFRSVDTVPDQEEAMRLQQEQRDEQLARRLQLEEEKRQKRMVEERDRRLAIKIQRREAEEYRRRKAERDMRRAASLPTSEPQESSTDGPRKDKSMDNPLDEEDNLRREVGRLGSYDSSNHKMESRKSENSPWERNPQHGTTDSHKAHNGQRTYSAGRADDHRAKNGSLVDSSLHVERVQLPEPEVKVATSRPTDLPNLKDLSLSTSENCKPAGNSDLSWEPAHSTNAADAPESPRHYNNIAATIDPTYKNSFDPDCTNGGARPGSGAESVEKSSISPSTPSRPVPVIQNLRRKKSVDEKKRKSSEKCKQQ